MSASIFLSVMAASLAVPQSSSAFDSAALALRDTDGVAVVRLFVAPDRTVEDCTVLSRGVSKGDAERVCGKLIGRRTATPASGPDGQAAYGSMIYIVGEVGGLRAEEAGGKVPADLVLDVRSLPGGARSEAVSLNLLLDETGKVARCESAGASGDNFVKAACASLAQQPLEIRKGSGGKPVPYVENVTVAFMSQSAGA